MPRTTARRFLRGWTVLVGFVAAGWALVLFLADRGNWPVAGAIIVGYLWIAGFVFVVVDMAEGLDKFRNHA